jgi:hypothetical protein
MRGVARGNMELIRSDDAQHGIVEFPAKLMPNRSQFQRLQRLRRVLDRVNHSRRRQKENN